MNRKDEALEQMERALLLSHFMSVSPINVMKRLKLHNRIAELHNSSMYLRSLRSDLLDIETTHTYEQFKSKINEPQVPTAKATNYEFT